MWHCFRLILLFSFATLAADVSSKDLLKSRILKYNHINVQDQQFKVDSAKLILPYKYFHGQYTNSYSTQYIKKQLKQKNYLLFFTLLTFMILATWIRYSMINTFSQQLRNFLSLKYKEIEQYSKLETLFYNILYIFSLSYLVLLIASNYKFLNKDLNNFYNVFLFFIIMLILRRLTIFLIVKIFGTKEILNVLYYIINDMVILTVMLFLPFFVIETISSPNLKEMILFVLLAIFGFFWIFRLFKIIIVNSNVFLPNIIHVLIYFLSIEVLPLILLSKYLSSNFV